MNTLPTKLFAAAATVAAAALIPAVQTATAGADGLTAYNSGNFSEQITQLPVGKVYPYPWRAIYCVPLNAAPKVGDVVHAEANMQVTTDVGYKVHFVTWLVLADSCTATVGTEISEANGYNLLPEVHHGTAPQFGLLIVTQPTARRYVLLLAYTKALAGTPWKSGDTLTVDQDRGRLTVWTGRA